MSSAGGPREWRIRIRHPDPDNLRRCQVDIDFGDGTYQGCRNIECELPPPVIDLLKPPGDGPQPQRRWRLAPERMAEMGDEGVLFGAGDLATLQAIGERLHAALFDFPGNDLTGVLAALSGENGVTVALDLAPGSPLERVPWEAMYSPRLRRFLTTNVQTNLVRLHDPIVKAALPDPVGGPIRLLVAVANPALDLDTDLEVASIRRRCDELVPGTQKNRFALTLLEGVNRTTFKEALRARPHIVHFIGHGDFDQSEDRGLLLFHGERNPNKVDPISADQLRSMLQNYRPWLVVLNSCLSARSARSDPFGGAAQSLIGLGVPFVVAMQYPISDEAAVTFSQSFYAAIAANAPVTDAVSQARNDVETLGEADLRPELMTPVLYLPTTRAVDRIAVEPVADAVPLPPVPPVPPLPVPPLPSAPVAAPAVAGTSAERSHIRAWIVAGGTAGVLVLSMFHYRERTLLPAPSSPEQGFHAAEVVRGAEPDVANGDGGGRGGIPERVSTGTVDVPATVPGTAPTAPRRHVVLRGNGSNPGDETAGQPQPVLGGGGSLALASSGIRQAPATLFLGGAVGSGVGRGGGVSLVVGFTLGAGRTRLHTGGSADIFAGPARAWRLGADVALSHDLTPRSYFVARAAYARQDATGIAGRETAGVALGREGYGALGHWSLEAGPVYRRTRRGAAGTIEEVAGSLRGQIDTRLADRLELQVRGDAVVGRTAGGHVGARLSRELSSQVSAEASADLDIEDRRAPGARPSAVIVRAGLRFDF